MLSLARLPLVSLVLLAGATSRAQSHTDTLPVKTPLRIRTTRTSNLHIGSSVTGVLTEPVYLRDHSVLPQNTVVFGIVTAYAPMSRKLRAQALLNGDVTPLHDPIVDFNRLQLPGATQQIAFSSRGEMRDVQLVRFVSRKKRPTYIQQAEDMARAQIQSVHHTFFTPGRTDRALRLLYSQLPYHPQRIWAGTGFVADLDQPMDLPSPQAAPVPWAAPASLDSVTVSARLDTSLTSARSKPGEPITATITRPVFNPEHQLIIPEGATLDGVITRVKPARSLGRNGVLRFAFRGLADETGTTHVDGNISGAAGAKNENLTVDDEGNVNANPDKGKLLAPLLLAFTAAVGHDDDGGVGQTVVGSNGFGLIARFIGFSNNKGIATGFGLYALGKSVYFRYLDRGHEVMFPRDTAVEVQLVSRPATERGSAGSERVSPTSAEVHGPSLHQLQLP